ncbi:M48 family metalloprotease [Arenibacterium sp. CAU 1754]
MRRILVAMALFVGACDVVIEPSAPGVPVPVSAQAQSQPALSPDQAARSFAQVVAAVEPVAERECRRLTPSSNCDFRIGVDPRRNAPPNAYQSEDSQGRPQITFTQSLIASARNADELAFVMSHEAAHHIRSHLARQRRNAATGAVIFAGLATLTGVDPSNLDTVQELGAAVGARSYSKEFELEADQLGTIIAHRAGFNPLRGAEFFARIPDPGDRFLGTHPPNAARLQTVRRTSAQLGLL